MNNSKKFKLVKIMMIIAIISLFFAPIFDIKTKAYEGNSREVEKMLDAIVSEYGEENVVFNDGIVLNKYDEVNLSDIIKDSEFNWISKDSSVVKINNEDLLQALECGTTFLIGEKDGKYYIHQVYVAPDIMEANYSISNYSISSERKTSYVVYLDPGHGGTDSGAVGNGLKEKDINLKIALAVRDKLQKMGVVVKMSRDTDVFVSLQDIATGANAAMPDVFVSIHQNSFTGTNVNGIETYWWKGSSDNELASLIQKNLINNTNANNRGVKKDDYYVIKNTLMPSSLVECGFITNPNEARLLASQDYQNKLADAIANGTYEYLKANVSVDQLIGNRIFGIDRFETSYEVFKNGWTNSDYVVIAPGYNYPDALCAAPLASKYDAPIVLSENASLYGQPKLLDLLKSKGVKHAFIVGGTGVIPSSMEIQLSEQGISSKRLGGLDRYETSIKIAEEIGSTTGEIALASGLSFADGLSISSIAAKRNMPIILTEKDWVPSSVTNYINSINVKKTYIAGMSGVVADNVASKFTNVERLGGLDRYETNRAIFNRFKDEMNLSNIYISSALDFPDALSVSALAGRNSGFVLLSNLSTVEPAVKDVMLQSKPYLQNVYILGSNALISDYVLYNLGVNIIR